MKVSVASVFLAFVALAGCSPLMLKPADFSWPVESVLKVNEKGFVDEPRYFIKFNVKGLLFAETKDSVNVSKVTLRMIRDEAGYYFITAAKFKNVYVFEQAEGGLKLSNRILVSEHGLNEPAFNKRSSNIELISEKAAPILMTKDGIREGGKK
jgi:hypothetical protein